MKCRQGAGQAATAGRSPNSGSSRTPTPTPTAVRMQSIQRDKRILTRQPAGRPAPPRSGHILSPRRGGRCARVSGRSARSLSAMIADVCRRQVRNAAGVPPPKDFVSSTQRSSTSRKPSSILPVSSTCAAPTRARHNAYSLPNLVCPLGDQLAVVDDLREGGVGHVLIAMAKALLI